MKPKPNVLSIAGIDPSGGAGLLADVKTVSALGCFGLAAETALTVQNTQGVKDIDPHDPILVTAQIDALYEDIEIAATKIGMLANVGIARAVLAALQKHNAQNIILDPVMASQSGHKLLEDDAVAAIKLGLMPRACIITPNMPEAEILLGDTYNPNDMEANAQALIDMGARAVLLKGGHGDGTRSIDIFAAPGQIETLGAPRIKTNNNHGTGCTLSSAIAAHVAQGKDLLAACRAAKKYITAALETSDQLNVGKGNGPVNHFYNLRPQP